MGRRLFVLSFRAIRRHRRRCRRRLERGEDALAGMFLGTLFDAIKKTFRCSWAVLPVQLANEL